MITKAHWQNILKELNGIRRKHQTRAIHVNSKSINIEGYVDKVSIAGGFIRLNGREYIRHEDIRNYSVRNIKHWFTWTIGVFDEC